MKHPTLRPLVGICTAVLLVAGCGTPIKHSTPLTKEQILEQPDVKNKPPVVYQKSIDEVRLAGLRSLTAVGCEIKTQEPYFLAGFRPQKFGLLVGSGGETVKLFLYPQDENVTRVWVDTDLSFVGMAGQQSWDKQTIEALSGFLNQTNGLPATK